MLLFVLGAIDTTSPGRTWNEGIVTRLPFTSTWPWRTKLARLVPARREAGAEHHVVDPLLQHPQQALAGDARLARRLLVQVAELLLEDAVDAACLLLLPQLEEVFAVADAAPGRAHPVGRACARPGTSSCRTSRPSRRASCARDGRACRRSCVARHQTLRRFGGRHPVRDRGHVLDAHDLDAGVLDRADRGAPAASRAP